MTRIASRPAGRSGFSLIEIMIAMFVLSLGLILLAAAFPAALRSVAETQDITTSSFGGRIGCVELTQFASPALLPVGVAGADSCGTADECVHWYGPTADMNGNGGSPRWFVDNGLPPNIVNGSPMAGWGRAIPFAADERYALQVFYRRIPLGAPGVSPAPPGWPHVYTISVVLQQKRNGTFAAPVSTRGDDTQLNAVCGNLETGDVYTTWDGKWNKYSGRDEIVPGAFGWGIPGGIGVFHTVVELRP